MLDISIEITSPRLVCLKLAVLDSKTDKATSAFIDFSIKYHGMPNVIDFVILWQVYERDSRTASSRSLTICVACTWKTWPLIYKYILNLWSTLYITWTVWCFRSCLRLLLWNVKFWPVESWTIRVRNVWMNCLKRHCLTQNQWFLTCCIC